MSMLKGSYPELSGWALCDHRVLIGEAGGSESEGDMMTETELE